MHAVAPDEARRSNIALTMPGTLSLLPPLRAKIREL